MILYVRKDTELTTSEHETYILRAGGEGGGVVEVCFNGGFNGRKIRHGSLLWENTGKLME